MNGTPLKNCSALISVKRQRFLRAGISYIQYMRVRQHVFSGKKNNKLYRLRRVSINIAEYIMYRVYRKN